MRLIKWMVHGMLLFLNLAGSGWAYHVLRSWTSLQVARCTQFQSFRCQSLICRNKRPSVRSMCPAELNLAENGNDEDNLSEEIQRALAAQGITWQDVLNMRQSIVEHGYKKDYSNKGKRAANSTASVVTNTAGYQIAKPEHLGTTLRSSDVKAYVLSSDEQDRRPLSTSTGQLRGKTKEPARRRDDGLSAKHQVAVPNDDGSSLPPPRVRSKHPVSAATATPVVTEGVTLEAMLTHLVNGMGFPALHAALSLKCFQNRPTIASSLKVLRQAEMEWARRKLQSLYIEARQRELSG